MTQLAGQVWCDVEQKLVVLGGDLRKPKGADQPAIADPADNGKLGSRRNRGLDDVTRLEKSEIFEMGLRGGPDEAVSVSVTRTSE